MEKKRIKNSDFIGILNIYEMEAWEVWGNEQIQNDNL